jgi:ferrous iron transport protein A
MAAATLDQLDLATPAVVGAVHAPPERAEWRQHLEDLGFVAGERVMLLARGAFGGDPLVVRVGLSTYALRRAEAACVALAATP